MLFVSPRVSAVPPTCQVEVSGGANAEVGWVGRKLGTLMKVVEMLEVVVAAVSDQGG